jgi:hypothetical protein
MASPRETDEISMHGGISLSNPIILGQELTENKIIIIWIRSQRSQRQIVVKLSGFLIIGSGCDYMFITRIGLSTPSVLLLCKNQLLSFLARKSCYVILDIQGLQPLDVQDVLCWI